MFIDSAANRTDRNRDGQIPLHLASHVGQVDVARMLIDHERGVRPIT